MSEADKFEPCFTFIWKIQNFSFCVEKCNEGLFSPEFAVDPKSKNCWGLQLYPRGCNELASDYIVLFINSTSDLEKGNKVGVSCEFSFLTNEGKGKYKKKFSKKKFLKRDQDDGFASLALQHKVFNELKSELLPEDTLTIQCCLWMAMEQDIIRNGFCSARTIIEVDRISFEWAVDEFCFKQQEKSRIILSNSGVLTTEFTIKSGDVSDDNVVIEIRQLDTTELNIATCHISHIQSTGEIEVSAWEQHSFAVQNGQQTWSFPSFLTKSYLTSNKDLNLPNDRLMLRCEYASSLGITSSVKEYCSFTYACRFPLRSKPDRHICEKGIKSDLKVLYDEKTLCNINLRVGSDDFPAHKAILCARSPVFKAMFTSDMKEKNSNFVNIEDLDGDTVERMLLFIYTDTVEDLTLEDASKLYFAAEKYDLLVLKQHCSVTIKSLLGLSNVYEVLELADMHHDEDLKKYVQNFIFLNDKEIMNSDDWERFAEGNTSLAFQTLNFLYKKKLNASN